MDADNTCIHFLIIQSYKSLLKQTLFTILNVLLNILSEILFGKSLGNSTSNSLMAFGIFIANTFRNESEQL